MIDDKHSNRRRTGNNSFQTSMDAYVLQYHQYGKTLGTSYRDMYESITSNEKTSEYFISKRNSTLLFSK